MKSISIMAGLSFDNLSFLVGLSKELSQYSGRS